MGFTIGFEQMRKRQQLHTAAKGVSFLTLALLLLPGCAATPESRKVPEVHSIAHRQLPPEPVYNRLRWVEPPEVMPKRDRQFTDTRPLVLPVFHLSLEDSTLKEASLVLAGTSRYHSYCSSKIADQKISLQSLGTIDELAQLIASQANIRVIIDHTNKEVRFLAQPAAEAEFSEPTSIEGIG
ncbi:MAG: hypothetical protein KDD55_00385 [Bdellovibrionales bacterium]|nr:hypothetical protein [Bdellovibrionales bacterium]